MKEINTNAQDPPPKIIEEISLHGGNDGLNCTQIKGGGRRRGAAAAQNARG